MENALIRQQPCAQTVLEACMLVCDAAAFACSVLILRWHMDDDSLEGFQDMGACYTVLCAISTFCALAVTLSLLFVPTQVQNCVRQ